MLLTQHVPGLAWVGVEDSFFELGRRSPLAVRVIVRLCQQLQALSDKEVQESLAQ